MSDFSNFSLSRLNKTIELYTNKMIELELDDNPDQGKIKTIADKLDKLDLALKEKNQSELASPSKEVMSGQPSAVPGLSALQKELQYSFRDVSSFTSGCDVHVFISNLELLYTLYVKDNKSDQMEQMFVRLATTKMSTDYAQTMSSHSPIVNTFELMKSYLKTHHASRMSSYQYLDTCWELQMEEAENLRDYARRIHDKMVDARNTIEAKFEAYKKSGDNPIENVSMTSKDVFEMVAGQIFLQALKMKSPRVFNHIVSDLDEVWNSADIANRAMAYQERMANEDEPGVSKPGTSLTIESKKSKKDSKNKGTCRNFIVGNCKYGEKCRYVHDKELKKLAKDKYSKTMEKDKNENSRANSGGGGNGQALTAVTLPNQDFCH